jgi:hypothetical protein
MQQFTILLCKHTSTIVTIDDAHLYNCLLREEGLVFQLEQLLCSTSEEQLTKWYGAADR